MNPVVYSNKFLLYLDQRKSVYEATCVYPTEDRQQRSLKQMAQIIHRPTVWIRIAN